MSGSTSESSNAPAAEPQPAESSDIHDIWLLRRELETWLAERGIDQWHSGSMPESAIAAQVRAGEWSVVRNDDGLVGAVRVLWDDPAFWDEAGETSVFVPGLMVRREHAGTGVGSCLLDWAAELGQANGAHWLRLDCAAGNERLCSYYEANGFDTVGVKALSDVPFDVKLWQRPTGNGIAA